MTTRRNRVSAPVQLESLEGRMLLSATEHPVHASATVHVAQAHVSTVHASSHKAPAVPNPVLVNLTPQTTGIVVTDVTYDKRINMITVTGTVELSSLSSPSSYPYYGYPQNYPDSVYLSVTATQAVTRFRSVSGYQSTTETLAAGTVTPLKFKEHILASPGEFAQGNTVLTVSESDSYYYSYSTLTVLVKMRNMNAY